ncbi:MAG: transposase [Gammaproteobacteria bacterium]|nr:transposase [Gammaproteobacteria bacterium]
MTDYRRANVPGGTYFFTVNLAERHRTDLVDRIDILKRIIREEIKAHPFTLDAIVVMPDHLHALWTLPAGDNDYSNRWRRLKATFSATYPPYERRSVSRQSKGERGIWQRRFWEHLIRDEKDLQRHFDYIHYNPVKHGYVKRVRDWPHSTFHRHVRDGIYSVEWAGGTEQELAVGEFE